MKLKPLADRVILKQFKAEEKTKSGLILAASAQEKPEMFEVVEVGPGGMVDGNEVKMTVAAGDRVIVGMGATVLDGAVIGNDCIIGAGALVTGKMNAPDGSMILGSPAKVVRELTEKEKESILANATLYLEKSKEYRAHAAKQA